MSPQHQATARHHNGRTRLQANERRGTEVPLALEATGHRCTTARATVKGQTVIGGQIWTRRCVPASIRAWLPSEIEQNFTSDAINGDVEGENALFVV